MSSLIKLIGKPIGKYETEELLNQFLAFLNERKVQPDQVWLFGSAARMEMKTTSDLDVLFVFPNSVSLRKGKENYYNGAPFSVCPVDALFTTVEDFERRSKVGGVPYICRAEGRLLRSGEDRYGS